MSEPVAVRRTWVEIALLIVFGLFYGFALFVAISNIVALPRIYEFFRLDPATIPWWLLIIGAIIPVAGYLGAIFVARRRNLLERALVLLGGLAAVSALGLTVVAIQRALL
ncbi:MAG: hypothetical protein ACOH1T_01950 [Microbacteriaceae bacterium]